MGMYSSVSLNFILHITLCLLDLTFGSNLIVWFFVTISHTGKRAYESEMTEKASSEMRLDYKFVKDEDDAPLLLVL